MSVSSISSSIWSLIPTWLQFHNEDDTNTSTTPQPTPPTAPYSWGDVENYLAEDQLWMTTNAANFTTIQLQTMAAALQQLREDALYCTDQKKLASIVQQAQLAINPPKLSPDQISGDEKLETGITLEARAQSKGNFIINFIQTLPPRMQVVSAAITQASNCLISVTDPTTREKLQAQLANCTEQANAVDNTAATMQKTISPLVQNKVSYADTRYNSLVELRKSINDHPNDHTLNAPILNNMDAALKQMRLNNQAFRDFNSEIQAAQTAATAVELQVVAIRKQIPSDQPSVIPPGQMYLDMNYIAAVFSKNPSPEAALTNYFKRLQSAGINRIDLSFSQLTDIMSFASPGPYSGNDTVGTWIQANPTQFGQLTTVANKCGMKIDISFGGQNATSLPTTDPKTGKVTPPDWQLPHTAAGPVDPTAVASALCNFMKAHSIDSIDIDIEADISQADTPERYVQFFTALHNLLAPLGKKIYLTTLASVSDWPDRFIHFLFYDANGKLIFPQMFDGINIMAYSATEYYLDPTNPTWGIDKWLEIVGKENAHMINIGFEDNVNYTEGSPPITSTSNGDAAAKRYINLLEGLKSADGVGHLGEIFVWPDYGLNPPDYQKGTLPPTTFETDFNSTYSLWNNLSGLGIKV